MSSRKDLEAVAAAIRNREASDQAREQAAYRLAANPRLQRALLAAVEAGQTNR